MATKRRPRSDARRGGPRGSCRGCGAPVFWLTVVKVDGTRGGKAPIDRAPSFDGNIEVDLAGETYRVVPLAEAREHRERCDAGAPPRLRRNHFAGCTNLTYRRAHGRVHVPSADEADAEAAWAADAGDRPAGDDDPRAAGVDLEAELAAPAVPLPRPGEYLVDPEEADGEPDDE